MHIDQLPSGSWRVRVSHAGRRASGTAPSRHEAQILGGQLLERLGRPPGDTATLVELLRSHLDHHPYAATTGEDYDRVLTRLAARPEGSWPIGDITTGRLVALYQTLARDGWTPHRVAKAHRLISAAFSRALRLDAVARNPARGAAPPEPRRPDIEPPTDADVVALLEAAGDRAPLYLVAAGTGVRRGELVALQWRDVDLDARSLIVRRSVTWTKKAGLTVKELKNGDHGYRVIALDAATTTVLTALRPQAAATSLALGLGPLDHQWLFPGRRPNRPMRPDSVTHHWARLRTGLGLDHVRLYDLRHWMITSMLAAGEPVATVAGRAGHDPVTMLRRYWHFVPASDADMAERHAQRLAAARAKPRTG